MRILFTASNWAGHYMCMVPLAWALRAAGHEIRVACPPSQERGVAATGLMPVPVLDGPDMMESARLAFYVQAMYTPPQSGPRPLPLHPFTGQSMQSLNDFDPGELRDFWKKSIDAVQRSYDNAVNFGEHWRPDLVVHDIMAVEGALVAALRGVPSVYVSPGFIGTVETEPGLDLVSADPLSCFEKYGVEWGRDKIEYAVDPSPDVAVPPMGGALRLPMRYVPYNGAQGVDPWQLGPVRGKRVCIVWGKSASGIFGADVPALRHAIDTSVRQGAEVVLTAPVEQVDKLGTLPAGVRVLRDCPLELILPQCDLLIHHGSANCYMNGIVAGVPQLSLALNYDTLICGRRIDPAGATVTLSGLEASAEKVEEALGKVLFDHRYRLAAQKLRDGVEQAPSPAAVAGLLTRLAQEGGLSAQDVAGITNHTAQARRIS
ncbi:nucleotide disphospho-sugar-binding domain-containing protein [Streptomyces sp. NPDC091272]|uniref:nucleotide disphospho-sugar-binding domain-containing protein n=1 Tax=Streptomyces sp. NPDC091272 TaxID=3365981 RepID=UPI00380F45C9